MGFRFVSTSFLQEILLAIWLAEKMGLDLSVNDQGETTMNLSEKDLFCAAKSIERIIWAYDRPEVFEWEAIPWLATGFLIKKNAQELGKNIQIVPVKLNEQEIKDFLVIEARVSHIS